MIRSALLVTVLAVSAGCTQASRQPETPATSDAHALPAPSPIDRARACANGDPWKGRGVGGSPLDFAHASTRPVSEGVLVTFPEEKPTTVPSGLDLVIAPDGRCLRAPMD